MIPNFKQFLVQEKIEMPKFWYHGAKNEFDTLEFRLKKGTLLDSDYISPIFLTNDIEFARAYSGYLKTATIYKVETVGDIRIFDPSILPTDYDLYMWQYKGKEKKSGKDYELGLKLSEYIESIFPEEDIDTSTIYNNLISGDYSSVERTWFYDWLKSNDYDGCYIFETGSLNCFIFDPKKLKIVSKV